MASGGPAQAGCAEARAASGRTVHSIRGLLHSGTGQALNLDSQGVRAEGASLHAVEMETISVWGLFLLLFSSTVASLVTH